MSKHIQRMKKANLKPIKFLHEESFETCAYLSWTT